MYESKHHPPISTAAFIMRCMWHVFAAFVLCLLTLLLGALGHMFFEDMSFQDALLNSSMIMGGLGTTMHPISYGGKIFFAFYGLFVGVLFAALIGVIAAPMIHRIVHKMHLEDEEEEG